MGIVIPAIVIGDNRAPATGGGGGGGAAAPAAASPTTTGGGGKQATKPSGGATAGGALAQGKTLFTQSCGSCHTLKDAGTAGQVGPVLDQIKPNMQRVLNAIKKGGLGSGTMPANLYTGKDAQAVAKYVSSVAGK
jgi:sulfite dehydrogenase